MKKLKGSTAAKIIALVLVLVSLCAALTSALGIALLENYGAYADGYDKAKSAALDAICMDRSFEAVSNCSNYYVRPDYIYPDSGFCFTVADSEGNIIYDNLAGRATSSQFGPIDFRSTDAFFADCAHTVFINTEIDGRPTPTPSASPKTEQQVQDKSADDMQRKQFTLTGYMLKNIPSDDDASLALKALDIGYNIRYGLFAIAVISVIVTIALFVFLMSAAGHRDGSDAVKGGFIEKIPFDLYTLIIIGVEALVGCCVAGFMELYDVYWVVRAFLSGISAIVFILVGILWCMSWAARIKLHTALKSCICYKLLAWLWRGVKKFFIMIRDILKGLSLIKRAAIITFAILVVEFFFIAINGGDTGAQLFGWFFERAILVALLLYALIGMKKLLAAGKELANGNMNCTVDTSKMRGVVKEHGEDLNNIGAGLNKAMAERMKSERFRTELITNVSHDIRTPLTSIISYVDLLAKENPDSEKEREYIEVLERQSARLKKLIDDLIEASKASTGNLTVNAERCEMGVLLGQIAGEYQEKLEKSNLELIQTIPEESIAISADGRHMWRIFDNLLNNACKYSQSGTRVYLSLEKKDGKAVVSVKNISKTQLNISGDELMERFVRGDSARNTEGSGLGLSIARSLTQLQKGDMSIDIDGDLFKVTISFPAI